MPSFDGPSLRCLICKKGHLKPWTGIITKRGKKIEAIGEQCSNCEEVFFDYEELGRQEELLNDLE